MKLDRTLTVAGIKRQLIHELITLEETSPGRAIFTIVNDDTIKPSALVVFEFGYSSQDTAQRFFVGFAEKVVPVGDKRIKLWCRELSAALAYPLPLDLRHVSMRDVLAVINEKTGLNFSTPDMAYATTKVANFYNLGTGYQAMIQIGRVFNVPDYIWQQQGNQIIYVGSWSDSRWATIKNMVMPARLFDGEQASGQVRVSAIPQLRPGMRINGNRIGQITFENNHMVLTWKR